MSQAPLFKAKTVLDDNIPCPWCLHEHDIMNNPSNFWPRDNDGYEDQSTTCSGCKRKFYVSCEVIIKLQFTSRYKPWEGPDKW